MQKFIAFSLAFFVLALAVYILGAAYTFFLPLVIAIVISYFLITLAEWIKKIPIGKWRLPDSLAYLAAIGVIVTGLWIVFSMVMSNVSELLDSAPMYQEKMKGMIETLSSKLRFKHSTDITNYLDKFDFVTVISSIVRMLRDIASYAGLIALYVIFILIEHRYFDLKLEMLFQNRAGLDKTRTIINKITSQIQTYLRIKTLLSFLTASCSYGVMLAVGVDFADFWAFLIFLLNFIPTIGSIIATVFPCLLTLLQFDSWVPFVVVTISLISLQFFIGNYLEPSIMGKSFNLSGLVIILSLTLWGSIWGVVGMFLCVPIMVIVSIVLANFEETKPVAILLSQDGNIE